MSSCAVCDQIWQVLSTPETAVQKIDLGSFDVAIQSDCPDHAKILKDFHKYCNGANFASPDDVSKDVGFRKGHFDHSITLYESVKNLGRYWELTVVEKPGHEAHPGVGRVLDPEWVDLKMMAKWKNECLSSHGKQCDNPMRILPSPPAWLIDVQAKCIVPGATSKHFVALSYRSSIVGTHSIPVAELKEAGALERPEVLDQIPLKIRHAMSLTSALDERYLWADFLCFDYTDPTTIPAQLSLMTSIYAGAVLTIIAADGDRIDGIHGIQGVSPPRHFEQRIFPFRNEHLVVRKSGIFALEHWHEYHERAWTYQEFKMSPRKLMFMNGQVHWQCNCDARHEEITYSGKVDTYIDPRPQVLASGFPDLGSLELMLSNYNSRKLTYDEDALAAVSGLLTVFSRSFEGGFLYGLPEMLFDRALAWQPHWSHTNLRRRIASGEPSRNRFSGSDLPSWSWTAWEGIFRGWGKDAVRINDRQNQIEEVNPITDWFTSSAPQGQPLRKILNTWYAKRGQWKDVTRPLSPGWTRESAPSEGSFRDEPMLYPDGCGQFVYKHESLSDPDCPTWYYPFPVPQIQLDTPYSMPQQTRYLFCKTQKTTVWSRRRADSSFHSSNDDHVLILHPGPNEDREIGTLQLQTDEQLALWPKSSLADENITPGSRRAADGRTVTVVAINHCVEYSKTFNNETQRSGYPLERKEWITVLWVEWENGVAYRLACGRVAKEAWDALGPKEVDLVLG